MLNIGSSPARRELQKATERLFVSDGWQIDRSSSTTQDIVVSCGILRLSVVCLDSTQAHFRNPNTMISQISELSRYHRDSLKRILLIVLERNFLLASLSQLLERGICLVTLDGLREITSLSYIVSAPPLDVTDHQKFIFENNVDVALSISFAYAKNKQIDQALAWAKIASKAGPSVIVAHIHLFSLYRDAGDFKKADEVADGLLKNQQQDPRVVRVMLDYANRRGDHAQIATWERKLKEQNVAPKTFEDIIKAHYQSTSGRRTEQPDPLLNREVGRNGFVTLKALRRSLGRFVRRRTR
jgi:hypothetical protein